MRHTVNENIKLMASDLAPELDRRIRDWLSSDMILGSKEYVSLEQLLWDNKIGILRIIQTAAHGTR